MKKQILSVMITGALCIAALPANAQFGRLLGGGSTSAATADPQEFIKSALAAEKLMNNSVALLAASLTSKEQAAEFEAKRKAAIAITDSADKKAQLLAVRKSEVAALNEATNNAQLTEKIKQMDTDQKSTLGAAAFNFMLALLLDKDLVDQGKSIISSLSSNPMNISKLGGVKDAVTSLGNQMTAASSIASKMPAVFTAVGVQAPASKNDKPKTTQQVDEE